MPKRKRSHPIRRFFLILFVLTLVTAAFGAWLFLVPFGASKQRFVDIPAHTGSHAMATALEQGGAIRSRWAFLLLREVEGGTLKAGEYQFKEPQSLLTVYRRVRAGDVYTVAVVIPEGFNLFDIAGAVEGVGLCSHTAFLEAATRSVALVRGWDPHATSVEGYLFPDTYRFSRHTTPEMMLEAMTRRFSRVSMRLGLPEPEMHRVVTIASLVEREVHVPSERALVAGVFENRLRAGMPLQTDPAVVYASMLRGTWTGVIHQSELRSDSAYNTYTHAGLPPGPICNPGVASLQAALHPEATNYLYFVANADGSTRFAQSLQEHNSNVSTYRSGLRGSHTQ